MKKTNLIYLFALISHILIAPGVAQITDSTASTTPVTEYPSQNFSSAEEHYRYLLDQAAGGTQHIRTGDTAGAICFAQKEDGSIVRPNNNSTCDSVKVVARWSEEGWLENGSHLQSHPAN